MRGTPQQIIDKYNQLARDAQLSNDRVAAENFQQHAEHYLRLLGEAQREIDARREEQERQNRDRQAQQDRERNERSEREAETPQPQSQPHPDAKPDDASDAPAPVQASIMGDVIDSITAEDGDSGLVETPESKPRKPRRKPKPKAEEAPKDDDGGAPEAAE